MTVKVAAPPAVQISYPSDGAQSNAPVSLTVTGTASDCDGMVTNVQLLINGLTNASALPLSSSNTFSTAWTESVPGFYTFVAVATDNDGLRNASSPVTIEVQSTSAGNHPPVAAITSPVPPTTNLDRLILTNAVVVRTGLLALNGSAYDPDGDPVSYQVLLLDPSNLGSSPLYNITPSPVNSQGFHEISVGITNGVLATNLDLSVVQNGTYLLTLVVRGGGDEATAQLLIAVDSNLKIGQFSFSEQDLVLPVNGIPVTVTRTYSSLNPFSKDFGYGWTYSINAMDVQLDEERLPVTIGTDTTPFADPEEEGSDGFPLQTTLRTGGAWDLTLTLPDGRRTTFAFNPRIAPDSGKAYAQWTPPPDVHATLSAFPSGHDEIDFFPSLHWADDDTSIAVPPFENHDIIGWALTNLDGTAYIISRGDLNRIWFDASGNGNYIIQSTYGPPQLSQIVQRTGDTIKISSSGIFHYASNNLATPTRSVLFNRDSQGRITAIFDPDATNTAAAYPSAQYIYNQDNGNLIQVLKLTDRNAGTYSTNRYNYDNPAFPHYITSIVNPLGVPVARNYYDDSGRLIAVVDANGNTNQFIHNLTNNVEVVIDRRGFTNSYVYDLNGNVTATTNAVGGISVMAYDAQNNKTNQIDFLNGQPYAANNYSYYPNGLLLVSINPLGYSNVFTYNTFGQVLTSTDARNNTNANSYDTNTGNLTGTTDALGNTTSYYYDSGTGLLLGSVDSLGNVTTNFYDSSGNLTGTALLRAGLLTILSTNSFIYDDNGNRTTSVVWRQAAGQWVGATNLSIYDGQNRVIQTVDANAGTNKVLYDLAGRQQATIDPLGHTTTFVYDYLGRVIFTTNADHTFTSAAYDSNGNRTSTTDQLGNNTSYYYDNLNRLTTTVFADVTTNLTMYDDLGRVRFTVDARGVTNAFGYDPAGRRIATTNALGVFSPPITNGFVFDPNGNQTQSTDALGRTTTTVFDSLNRAVQVLYADGTTNLTGYDAAGRRVAQTNQDGVVTRFGYDGAGRLTSVTNAFGVSGQQIATSYAYDEAGNEITQIDALGRITTFKYDGLGHRTSRILPQLQTENLVYDLGGNLKWYTNFNGVVITNLYDGMNRITNRSSVGGYGVSFAYDGAGNRTNMTDSSGVTGYSYDNRNRLLQKSEAWSAGPTHYLNYAYDANGNLTKLYSGSTGGVTNFFAYDSLNRITNFVASGSAAASYSFDPNGTLQAVAYGNGVTNQYLYDALNRLTNSIWKSNQLSLATFYYQLGPAGNRKNLTETLLSSITNRAYAWGYDSLYRLTSEAISVIGTNSYGLDSVGNRTNRTAGLDGLLAQSFAYSSNDWVTTDQYDTNGNTLWTTNGVGIGPYNYDPENRLTSFSNAGFGYNGDGIRVSKSVGTTTNYYLVDDRNPTGYPQVVEEWTGTGGAPTLTRYYNYGLALVSQQDTTLYYFVPDGHGSTRLLLTSSGAVANALAYDAYGNLVASNTTPQTVYLSCGEQFDTDLGFYYLRARYLNPNTGRFWTTDSHKGMQERPLSFQKYLFCEANPLSYTDPTGHDVAEIATIQGLDMALTFGVPYAIANYEATAAPDFTTAVLATLRDIETKFTSPAITDQQRTAMISQLNGSIGYQSALASFDIIELQYPSAQHRPYANFTYDPGIRYGPPNDNPTVGFMGRCYYANAVNYAMFGLMVRLAADFTQDHQLYSLNQAVTIAGLFNITAYGIGPGDLDYDEKEEFVRFGYDRAHSAPTGKSNPNLHVGGVGPTGVLHWVWEPTFTRHNPYPGQRYH